MNHKLIFEEESFKIRNACFEVYNEMGPGFLENVYQECLMREFSMQKLPFSEQKNLQIFY